jgi:hypothetical protein
MARQEKTVTTRRARAKAQAVKAPHLRVVTVLIISAGIAFLGLLSRGDERKAIAGLNVMDNYFPADMPHYPGVKEVPAGPSSQMGGARVRMSQFTTDHDPYKVASYYSKYWRSHRLWVNADVTHRGGVVSAIDVQKGQVYQLLLTLRGKQTWAFASLTRMPGQALKTETQEPPLKLMPGSKAVSAFSTQAGGQRARVNISVNEQGLDQNLAYYRAELRRAGYTPERAASTPLGAGHKILIFSDMGGNEITVNLAILGGQRVRVHMMAVGR